MLETMTTTTVLEYVEAIRHAAENNDTDTVILALNLLEDIINCKDNEYDVAGMEYDAESWDDYADSCGLEDTVNDHCDYCGSDGMETYGIQDSETSACLDCMENHFELTTR